MVVDDDTITLRVLVDLLKADYQIMAAKDGIKALQLLENSDELPDLIILDVMMPNMSGYQVCQQLKQHPKTAHIPVIFISSRAEVEDEVQGFATGGVDYITKPFNAIIVRSRVRTHVELKQRGDILAKLSILDGLTQLYNRRRFDEMLDYEWYRSLRASHSMALILMDIDYFKRYNDHYGHANGDACLKAVARALTSSMQRTADFVARYGGEEFVCILPETDRAGALIAAERIRRSVLALNLPHATSDVTGQVTISLGVMTMIPASQFSPHYLIEKADAALYASKRNGRNRVTEACA